MIELIKVTRQKDNHITPTAGDRMSEFCKSHADTSLLRDQSTISVSICNRKRPSRIKD